MGRSTVAAVETRANGDVFRLGHRPALDGIRGFGFLAVFAFHAGLSPVSGGHLAIEVFFVLSGFLITCLLLEERRTTSTIHLGFFYARRALRLLPGLVVFLAGTTLYKLKFPDRIEVRDYWTDALAALFYVYNWVATEAEGLTLSVLSHTWTLSVEEQFYLLWPLTLVLLLRYGASRAAVAAVLCAGIIGSAVSRAILVPENPGQFGPDPRAIFGLDVRGGAILVGCLVALAFSWNWVPRRLLDRRIGDAAAFVGLGLIAWIFFGPRWNQFAAYFEPRRVYVTEGLPLFALASALVVAGVVAAPGGYADRLLGVRPLAWIGRLSYGLYLWHVPVILATARGDFAGLGLSSFQIQLLRIVATFTVASLSFYLVEQPILRLKRKFTRGRAPTGQEVTTDETPVVAEVMAGPVPERPVRTRPLVAPSRRSDGLR